MGLAVAAAEVQRSCCDLDSSFPLLHMVLLDSRRLARTPASCFELQTCATKIAVQNPCAFEEIDGQIDRYTNKQVST